MSKPVDEAAIGPSLVVLGAVAAVVHDYFELIYQVTAWTIMVVGGFISVVTFVWRWQDRRLEAARRAGRLPGTPRIFQHDPPEVT